MSHISSEQIDDCQHLDTNFNEEKHYRFLNDRRKLSQTYKNQLFSQWGRDMPRYNK